MSNLFDALRSAPPTTTNSMRGGGIFVRAFRTNGMLYFSAGLRKLLGRPSEVAVYLSAQGLLIEPANENTPPSRRYRLSEGKMITCREAAAALLERVGAERAEATKTEKNAAAWEW